MRLNLLKNNSLLLVVSGPSGTGKGTVCAELLKDENLFLSVSATSREIRIGEVDKVTYYYKTLEEFETMIKSGQMLEWAKYSGNYYGTPKETVLDMMNDGKDVLLEIDVQGAVQIKEAFPQAILIFILPPSIKELKNRLTERGRESEEHIKKRIEAAGQELLEVYKYDYVVVNDDLSECIESVREIIRSEKKSVACSEDLIKQLQDELKGE